MPVKLVDNVKIYNTTTGTGAIVLGTPVPAYRGVEALTNGQVYSYSIHQGANFEYGRGTYLAAGQQLIRSPMASSTGGTALDLQPNAEVAFVALAEDIQNGPPTLELFADRNTIANDSAGTPDPTTQTTTFTAIPYNFSGVITWSLTDFDGTALIPVTDYLSSDTGASVTMTAAAFTTGRGATRGVIVTATPPAQSGAAARSWTVVGTDPGINAKTLVVTTSRSQIKYDSTGTATPSTQTTTLTANKQNTTATVTWTITDLSGTAVTPASTYLSADTGDSVTMTRPNFDSARGSTKGVIVTGTATDGSTFTSSVTVVANQDGAAGTNGTTGSNLVGTNLPGDNVGANGDTFFYSGTSSIVYPQKTGGIWDQAVDLKTGTLIPRVRSITDFAIGTYPSSDLPNVRTGQVTNLIVEDSVRSPTTYNSNVAVQHPTYGVLGYPQSTILMSSLNPGDGVFDVNMPVTGKVAISMIGPGQVTSASGVSSPATATNFGTLVSAPGAWQALNVTAAGHIKLTTSGTDATTRIQVEYRTNQPTFSVPTPFAGATGTRTADSFLASGPMLTPWQASTGTAIIDVHRLADGGSGAAVVLAFNGSGRLQIVNDTTITYTDGTHSMNGVLQFSTFANSVARVVLSWAAGKVMLYAGSGPPIAVSFDLNNGTARTSVRYTAPGTDGQQSLCGGISRISFALNNATLDPVDCYDLANQARPIPKATALIRDVEANNPFPVWKAGLYEMSQGRVLTNGVWPIFIMVGASTTRGNNQVGATTQASSIAGRWAIRETAAGYPAYLRGLMGSAGYSGTSAQTNSYNPQMSVSAGWTPGWGTTAGGGTLTTTTASCTESETPLEVTNGYRWFLFTNNGGAAGVYGRVQLTATDGTHTATKTFDCNLAPGVTMVELTASDLSAAGVVLSAGGVTYTLTTLDAGKRVSIAGRFPWNSLTPHVIVLTAGAPGYPVESMDIDAISTGAPENSWYEVLRQMQPTFMTLEFAGNSAVNQTAFPGFKTATTNMLTKCVDTGADVVMMTNLNLGTSVVAKNIQDKYQNYAIGRVRPLGGRGTIDLYNMFGKSSDLVSMGVQNTDKIHPTGLVDSTHPLSGNDIIAKRFQDVIGRSAMGV